MPAPSLKELKRLTREELERRHDALAASTQEGLNYYLDEVRRRDAANTERTMRRLTWAIFVLTLVIAVATLLLLGRP